jgi:hypothetical protein
MLYLVSELVLPRAVKFHVASAYLVLVVLGKGIRVTL